jgi:hypothetical protein
LRGRSLVADPIDILLVEDYENDVEFALALFRRNGVLNKVFVVREGIQALDLLFRRGAYHERSVANDLLL